MKPVVSGGSVSSITFLSLVTWSTKAALSAISLSSLDEGQARVEPIHGNTDFPIQNICFETREI